MVILEHRMVILDHRMVISQVLCVQPGWSSVCKCTRAQQGYLFLFGLPSLPGSAEWPSYLLVRVLDSASQW